MVTRKLNAEQFENFTESFKGVVFVYTRNDGRETAHHFLGNEYEAVDKSQDEVFRVFKNLVATFWSVKQKEIELQADNGGIKSNLRASTPSAIIFHSSKGELIKRFDLDESVWAKIGLVPTKKDLEKTARDYKKTIHAAAKAAFDALGFRVILPKDEVKPEVKTEKEKKTEKAEVLPA